MWRYRDSTLRPGLALGLAGAVKFFLWPLGVWLLALRRTGAAFLAAGFVAASLLLVLPFTGLDEFARLMVDLGRAFGQDGYSPFGLLMRLGASDATARALTLLLGAVLLILTCRRRSFALAIAASLALAPIVWLDYYALTAVSLAVARPRLSWIWLLPLATWASRAQVSRRTPYGALAACSWCSASSYGLPLGTSRLDGRERRPDERADLVGPTPRPADRAGGASARDPRGRTSALARRRHRRLGFPSRAVPPSEADAGGYDPYPAADHDPATGTNLVWPPAAALLVSPLTLVSPGTAELRWR